MKKCYSFCSRVLLGCIGDVKIYRPYFTVRLPVFAAIYPRVGVISHALILRGPFSDMVRKLLRLVKEN